MEKQELFAKILLNFDAVVHRSAGVGGELRVQLEALHPADIAYFFSLLDDDESQELFLSFGQELQLAIFEEFSETRQATFSSFLTEKQLQYILMNLSIEQLSGFFDELSDEELDRYLRLLHKKEREQVLSVLQCPIDSAGRYMDSDVITLIDDFTVERSIQLLQRLQPDQELHRCIFLTTREGKLVGHILLEDLVLKKPQVKLSSIARKNEFAVPIDEDRESVAQKMTHYNVMTAPVIDQNGHFLGVIPADALVDILEEESSEDIMRMASMSPMRDSYFETPFVQMLLKRAPTLVVLLIVQSFSTVISEHYSTLLAGFLIYFAPMINNTGGSASSQTSALVIQGLATGELDERNIRRFILREFFMSVVMGFILAGVTFIRVYYFHGTPDFIRAFAISSSLCVLVVLSVMLGGCVPFVLKYFKIDPAHSAGPLLMTLMDIIGLLTFCLISGAILATW